MKQWLFAIPLLAVALPTTAEDKLTQLLDELPSANWFMTSQSRQAEQFDLWQINSGYAYSINDNFQVYLSTQLTTSTENNYTRRGLSSGVKYALNNRVWMESALHTEKAGKEEESTIGVELSSGYQVTDQINLRATFDYEQVEQVYQLGIGFRF